MPFYYSKTLNQLLKKWPGRKIFGVYRFLPVFFIAGAALEFVMVKFRVGEVNFYTTYKKRRIEEMVEERLRQELLNNK